MHLSLVPKRTFNVTDADYAIPIPPEALIPDEDAPTADTPLPLTGLRYFFTGQEEAVGKDMAGDFWEVALSDFEVDREASVVPLITAYHLETMVAEIFTQWQAARPCRHDIKLSIRRWREADGDEPDAGLVIGFAQRP